MKTQAQPIKSMTSTINVSYQRIVASSPWRPGSDRPRPPTRAAIIVMPY